MLPDSLGGLRAILLPSRHSILGAAHAALRTKVPAPISSWSPQLGASTPAQAHHPQAPLLKAGPLSDGALGPQEAGDVQATG